MSSQQLRELTPDQPESGPEVIDKRHNLVSITGENDAGNNVRAKLEQLAELLKERDEAIGERLDVVEPISEALVELAADLGMRTEDLERAAAKLGSRADEIESAHQDLAERTANLAQATDRMREENDRRAAAMEAFTRQLQKQQDRSKNEIQAHAEELGRLEGRTNELDQMDYQLSEEIEVERSRVNRLKPRVEAVEEDTARLGAETAALADEDGAIRQFLKRATWSVVIVALLLAAVIGALIWSHQNSNQQIESLLSDLGVQQQHIAAIEGMVDALAIEMQGIPEQLDNLYQAMTEKDAQLQQGLDQVNSDVADIQKRIFVPEQNLSQGAYDLNKVRNDQWLLAQQPNHYTIQIAGVYGKNALANFIGRYRKHLNLDEIAYLHTTYKGRDWYVLMQGSYASAAQANAAMDAMAPEVQNNGPYVRKFERIQERVNFRLNAE